MRRGCVILSATAAYMIHVTERFSKSELHFRLQIPLYINLHYYNIL